MSYNHLLDHAARSRDLHAQAERERIVHDLAAKAGIDEDGKPNPALNKLGEWMEREGKKLQDRYGTQAHRAYP